MKYLVAIRIGDRQTIVEFKTKKQQQEYVKECKKKGIEYATSEG